MVQNTATGLKPLYDEDYDKKRMLRVGEVYEVEVRLKRNIRFHRKYFALIACAWNYLTEKQTAFFKSRECFRKTMEMAAGYCEPIYSVRRREFIEMPKSISFDSCTPEEFEQVYGNVRDVIFKTALRTISQEDFEANLNLFL